jgi:hypothetical protein
LSSVLQQLVSYEGEPALNEIIENNPDKDLFMDYFKKKFQNEEQKVDKGYEQNLMLQQYMNFSGQQLTSAQQIAENKSLTNQTAFMVIIGAAFIGFAILLKK